MAFRNVPEKKYRLHDGSNGTEYEALMEVIKTLERQKEDLETKIEEYRWRLQTAEGHP